MQKSAQLLYTNNKFDKSSEEIRLRPGEMAQQLKELVAPPEDPD